MAANPEVGPWDLDRHDTNRAPEVSPLSIGAIRKLNGEPLFRRLVMLIPGGVTLAPRHTGPDDGRRLRLPAHPSDRLAMPSSRTSLGTSTVDVGQRHGESEPDVY